MDAPVRDPQSGSGSRSLVWLIGALLALALTAWAAQRSGFFARSDLASRGGEADSLAGQPVTSDDWPSVVASRFLNTTKDVAYVGSQVCAECHRSEHESYLHTNHSRAFGDLVADAEPPDAQFTHQRSGRDYRVYRSNGQLWHRESVRAETGDELVLANYPMRYVIGSGAFSRSYLVEDDGFLIESPITWYTARQQWSMSPGYDRPFHYSFDRIADVGCIRCHAGRIEAADGNRFRVRLMELSIGCESCHGPGALHVARRQSHQTTEPGTDLTVVNPTHLAREESEAVCAACHLRGAATVLIRGRDASDYRPGLRMADFRIEYGLEQPDGSMKVVGHVEQMRLSKCYQQSDHLTCTTCHNPHAPPDEPTRVSFYRDKCLDCHTSEACGLAPDKRLELNSEDNCVACHMPQSPTDIPHFAFTHHRIGLHENKATEGVTNSPTEGTLIPFDDISHLSPLQRDRCLGLAYLELSDAQSTSEARNAYRRRAHQLLENVRTHGLQDGDVDAALSRLYWELEDHQRAISLAESALRNHPTSGARVNALFVIGESYLRMGRADQAIDSFETLVTQRRHSEDWLLLAFCRQRHGDAAGAIEALERAVEISGFRADLREVLAELHSAQGRFELAEKYRRAVEILAATTPPVRPDNERDSVQHSPLIGEPESR